MHELQPEMPNPRRSPRVQMRARFLRLRSEHRIAASDIRHHRMRAARLIPQLHAMLLTRPAAILVACSARQKSAEHAMLRMEHRQVLIRDGLDILRARIARQIRDLRRIQIVRRREPRDQLQILRRRQRIRRIQTEIADQRWMLPLAQRLQDPGRPHQNLAIQTHQKIDDPGFPGLQHSRTCHPRRNPARLDALHRRPQPVEVEIIQRDARGPRGNRRLELLRRPHQQMQLSLTAPAFYVRGTVNTTSEMHRLGPRS